MKSKKIKPSAKTKRIRPRMGLILVRTHRHGTLKLRWLAIGDLEFVEKLLEMNITPREFVVRFIHHQLASPELSIDIVETWPDKLLARVIISWAKDKKTIGQQMKGNLDIFPAFKQAIKNYLEEHYKQIGEILNRAMDSIYVPNLLPSIELINGQMWSQVFDSVRISQNAFVSMLDSIRPIDTFVNPLDNISQDWLEQIASNLDLSRDLNLATSPLGNYLGEIIKTSKITESLLAGIQWAEIGSRLQISPEISTGLQSVFIDFSQSYGDLYKSFQASNNVILSLPPIVSWFPTVEYFTGSDLLEVISVEEEIGLKDDRKQRREEILLETEGALRSQLLLIEPGLVQLWEGAVYSLDSENPDRARHLATSLRELFTHVLHLLAPDAEVQKWSTKPEHYHENRPTRKARLLYICRNINSGPFSGFVEKDIDVVLEFVQLFQRGTHEILIPYTPDQLLALKVRMEGVIRFLIEISKTDR